MKSGIYNLVKENDQWHIYWDVHYHYLGKLHVKIATFEKDLSLNEALKFIHGANFIDEVSEVFVKWLHQRDFKKKRRPIKNLILGLLLLIPGAINLFFVISAFRDKNPGVLLILGLFFLFYIQYAAVLILQHFTIISLNKKSK